MKKEIADKWVLALRSGKYAQGKHRLCDFDRYCCLGVLCELATTEGVTRYNDEEGTYGGIKEYLPPEVGNWAEMSSDNGDIDGLPNGHESLAVWNDHGATFSEIADLIEKRWEAL